MNRDQLSRAHHAAGLAGSLDDALGNPLLARCLAITATAIGRSAPPPSRPTPQAPAAPLLHKPKHAAGRDFKRACAGDQED